MDMAGNALEWVADWYDADYYSNSPSENPQGPSSGDYRVLRGGGWLYGARRVESRERNWYYPDDAIYGPTIRCALSP
jgi:formylglycine-generating enzyme required for sulfatase activity